MSFKYDVGSSTCIILNIYRQVIIRWLLPVFCYILEIFKTSFLGHPKKQASCLLQVPVFQQDLRHHIITEAVLLSTLCVPVYGTSLDLLTFSDVPSLN